MSLPEATMVGPKAPVGAVTSASAAAPTLEHATLITDGDAGGLTAGTTTGKKESGFNPMPIVIGGVLVVLLLAVVVVGILAGPRILASLQSGAPTAVSDVTATSGSQIETPGAAGTATTDPVVVAAFTQQAATAIAINGTNEANQTAIAQLQATDTPPPTQDLTATFAACTFDAAVTKIMPNPGTTLALNKANPVAVEIQNNGNCAWDDQTQLVLESGDDLRPAGQRNTRIPPAAPGDKVIVNLIFQPTESKLFASKWVIRLADGRDVGQPLALSYKSETVAVVTTSASTQRATPGAVTVTPGGPTSTPFVEKNLSGVSLRFQSCSYNGDNYVCNVAVNIDGGAPVWNVAITGANGGQFTWDVGGPRVWQMVAGRCEAVTVTVVVIDSNNDQVENTLTFDPGATSIFPGGTTCSTS
jgi:hypothetical protein